MGHSPGGLRVFRANDGHYTGHIVAVVLLDGQEIVLLCQEVEHGLDIVGDVADIYHLVAQQHARQQAAVLVDLLHCEAHGLHEVVAQHLRFVPRGATGGWGGKQVQKEEGWGRGQPVPSTCHRKESQGIAQE